VSLNLGQTSVGRGGKDRGGGGGLGGGRDGGGLGAAFGLWRLRRVDCSPFYGGGRGDLRDRCRLSVGPNFLHFDPSSEKNLRLDSRKF
jgi:hypothetical protein